jgi:hypothetical protein
MASKYDKMFPTRKQNQETARKAAESHRDILFSQRNVFGQKTQPLTQKYLAKKRRKRPNAPKRADFFHTGSMYKSFRAENRKTSKKRVAYALNSYLKLKDLPVGLSKGKNYQYALEKNAKTKKVIPTKTFDLIVNDLNKNMTGNLKKVLRRKKDFKITLTI